MEFLSKLLGEVETIRRRFGVEPERPLPSSVQIVEYGPEIHSKSSISAEGTLQISSELLDHLSEILKKEALSLFIPPSADDIPQVHDLAWAYSGISPEIWEAVRIKPQRPFNSYDPVTMFSVLSQDSKYRVIRNSLLYVKASASRGQLTLPLYLYLLNKFLGEEIELTTAEKSIMKVLSRNPYADRKEIREVGKVSEASISRSLNKLRSLGCIFGPENVRLWKLGLITLIASFPNKRKYQEAFWEFPFTYNQLIPVSGEGRAYAYLVVPTSSFNDLLKLSKYKVELGIVKVTVQRFNFNTPRDPLNAIVRTYISARASSSSPISYKPERPPARLTKSDIRVLNHIMEKGRVTSSSLKREGIRSAKQRLGKLRSSGIIGKYYMVDLPMGYNVILLKISCQREEATRLIYTLSAVSTAIVHYVEGKRGYCLALAFIKDSIEGGLMRGIKIIYGDDVKQADEILNIRTSWLLPEELWDEKEQTFRWEDPIENLISMLELSK